MSEAVGCTGVWKRFGELVANRDINLSVPRGAVHAIIGENGAGKSTLMRALYGIDPPDEGQVRIGGEIISQPSVNQAIARRVGMVHQHFMLVPTLTVTENVVLGAEPVKAGFLDLATGEKKLRDLSGRFGFAEEGDLFRRRVSELSVGEAQRVEILKVLFRGAETLILDEPTAVLTPLEVKELFSILRTLCDQGNTVVIVTHKLDEVMAIADRITVLRRAQVVLECKTEETSAGELARAMVGREVTIHSRRRTEGSIGAVRLSAESLTVRRSDGTVALNDVSFAIRGGEILGVAGVEGNGQSELALALAGVLPAFRGRLLLDGTELTRQSVLARRKRGLGHVPEDRHARGLLLDATVEDNFLLGLRHDYRRGLFGLLIDRGRLSAHAQRRILELDVRPAALSAQTTKLSGGNQQKVVIGRELGRPLSALICAQPTRGVDVGAIERIHDELVRVQKAGAAILLLSAAELDELLALCTRVIVLHRGHIVGVVSDLEHPDAKSQIGQLMLGARIPTPTPSTKVGQ